MKNLIESYGKLFVLNTKNFRFQNFYLAHWQKNVIYSLFMQIFDKDLNQVEPKYSTLFISKDCYVIISLCNAHDKVTPRSAG